MTFEQAFNLAMNKYPALYTSPTVELSKMKFCDQIFNTIGNGISTADAFELEFTITEDNKHLINSYPDLYITSQPLYTVCHKTPTGITKYFQNLYTQEQAAQFTPQRDYTSYPVNKFSGDFSPYPNFESKYSLVYNIDLSRYDSSWTVAAIFYYSKMKEWFTSNSVCEYAAANHLKDMQSSIASYQQMFKRYVGDAQTVEEQNANISKVYGIEYTGDIEQFIVTRWKYELNRIMAFIDETLVKLQQ